MPSRRFATAATRGSDPMYFDYSPCEVCGAEVQLRSHRTPSLAEPDGAPDERTCTNGDCETHRNQ